MKKRFLRTALLLLLVMAAGGGAYTVMARRPVAVEAVAVERDIPIQVFGLGTVEARILSRIGFEAAGTLARLAADHGDRVAEGAVLAGLDASDQRARLLQAEAHVVQARAGLEKAAAGALKAGTQLGLRQQVNERRKALVSKGTVSVEKAEDAQAEVSVAQAEHALALSEVEVARAALRDAEARLDSEKVRLTHFTLSAPYDALVIARNKELGAVLNPGEVMFTLIDPRTVWVRAYVDEALAGALREGQPAEIRLRSRSRAGLPGRIVRIDIESDRVNEERRVHVAFEAIPEDFHLGEQAEVLITTARLEQARLVPEAAVEGFDGARGMVWTVEDGVLARRMVEFGLRTLDGRLEVVGGLDPAVPVLRAVPPGARAGRPARVEDGRAP